MSREEESDLYIEREKYLNNEKIVSAVTHSYNALEGELSINAILSTSRSYLLQVTAFDKELEALEERLDSAKIELDDIADSLRQYAEANEYDEKRANYIENRVDTIRLLKRKYGASIEIILEKLDSLTLEYDELVNADEELEKLEKERQSVLADLSNAASSLSTLRKAAAKTFEQELIKELKDLAIKNIDFAVDFSPVAEEEYEQGITSNGFDTVEFMISPNLGEPLKSLARIASGGEMSRVMLALENIITGLDGIETLVFDEIDTGISGNVAHTVAKKLNKISRAKQVIAITHLPQLASFADYHYLITKTVRGDKTITSVTLLNEQERVEEIVRLSGGEGSEISIMHAKELLSKAKQEK